MRRVAASAMPAGLVNADNHISEVFAALEAIRQIAGRLGEPMATIALAWV